MKYFLGALLLACLMTPSVTAAEGQALPCPYPYYPFCGLQPGVSTPAPAADPAPIPKPTPSPEERLIKDDRPTSDEPARFYTPAGNVRMKRGVYHYSFGTLTIYR